MQTKIEDELAALRHMSTSQLCQRYAELFGEATRTRHKQYLLRRIAWRMQAMVEGDLSIRARRRAAELANDADVRRTPPKNTPFGTGSNIRIEAPLVTDRRLPAPGTAITRKYKGRTIQVVVLPDGYEYAGMRYKSLSAVAKAVTGAHCNGFRFFQLEPANHD